MEWIKTASTVLWNLLIIFFVLAILDTFSYSSDNTGTIASLLFLLYATLNFSLATLIRNSTSFALAQQKQNTMILRKLGDTENANYLEEDSEKIVDKLKKTAVRFSVNMLGSGIVWLIAVASLFH